MRSSSTFSALRILSRRGSRCVDAEIIRQGDKVLTKDYTESTEAYQNDLKGRYYYNKWTGEGFRKSIRYFQESIGEDPEYVLAYAGLADAYNALTFYNIFLPQRQCR